MHVPGIFHFLWVKPAKQGSFDFHEALKIPPPSRCRGYDSDDKGYLTPAEAEKFLDSVRAATDLGGRRCLQPWTQA